MSQSQMRETKELAALKVVLFQKEIVGTTYYAKTLSDAGGEFSKKIKTLLSGIDPKLMFSRDFDNEQKLLAQLPNDYILLYILLCDATFLDKIQEKLTDFLKSEESNEFTKRFIVVVKKIMLGK